MNYFRVAALGLGLSFMLGLSACGTGPTQSENSSQKVTNGVDLGSSEYPAVVLLVMRSGFFYQSICTGTFVNDYQVVTAAHCVRDNPTITALGRTAQSYKSQAGYSLDNNGGVNNLDLAVVNFPRGTSSSWRELGASAPEKEDQVVIVGYGNNKIAASSNGGITGSGSGKKRFGRNQVYERAEGMITIVGVPESGVSIEDEQVPPGEFAATGSGDSGGPLFFEDTLVGVTSGGGVGETDTGLTVAVGRFTDLRSETSLAFLSRYIDSGN